MRQEFDLVIIGGGMAGATLAWGLSHILGSEHGLKIAIVEAAPSDQQHPGFDARVIALSYGSRDILEQLGLWDEFNRIGTPITDIQVTDRGHLGQVDLRPQDYQLPALGYVVELTDSGEIFHQAIAKTEVVWFRPNSVAAVTQFADRVEIDLEGGEQLSAKLLAAADGGNSKVRQLLNIGKEQTDFGQSAIIANITTSEPHEGKAFERFTKDGPLALLPMSQGRSSLVWSMPHERVPELMAMDDAAFLRELQREFGYRLGRFEKTGKRVSYPLILTTADELVSHRCVFLGNAAQALHPIAGQGFNLGLRDVAELIHQLANACQAGEDIGEFQVLDRYRVGRQDDRQQTLLATGGLVSLFSTDSLPFVVGRNIGLTLAQWCPPLKRPIARQMLGRRAKLTPLKPL